MAGSFVPSPEAGAVVGIERPMSNFGVALNFFEIDRTLLVVITTRVVSLAANAMTFLLIAKRLSPVLQGYFYTFTSLLALQSFVELGFSVVITQFASHEWSRLNISSDGGISGDQRSLARLASLVRLVDRWYAVAGLIFVLAVGAAGCLFFSRKSNPDVHWFLPWLVLVPLTAIKLWLQPTLSLLEGCGQVSHVASIRLIESLVCNIGMWCALLMGAGLWISPLSSAASLIVLFGSLTYKYRRFFSDLRCAMRIPVIAWSSEIWPMQWRLALSGVVNYFAFSLFTPVMFSYHGPVQAGQMGMTLTLIGALTSIAAIWIQAKVPSFGVMIARKDYEALDRTFIRAALGSLSAMIFGALCLVGALYLLPRCNWALSQRLLAFIPTVIFVMTAVLAHGIFCIFAYLRAHKKEPLAGLSVTASLLTGFLVWLLGREYGPIGAACAQLLVVGAVLLPSAVWLGSRYRAEWHQPDYIDV